MFWNKAVLENYGLSPEDLYLIRLVAGSCY